MISYVEGFRCLACGAEHGWGPLLHACRRCGANLDVAYDYPALRRKLKPAHWRAGGTDLARFRALLPLETAPVGPLPLGGTPLWRARALEKAFGGGTVYLKDDTRNPSASFKDRASWVVLLRAREERARVVAAASTGNAGASLACLAAASGQPCVIFVPRRAPKPKVAQLQVFGARVLAVDGTYDDAFDLCARACGAYGWYNRNTGMNPLTREGKKTAAYEIYEQLGGRAPDWVFVPTGDGNILSGVWKGFRDLLALGWIGRLPRLAAVQSTRSNAIVRAWRAGRTGKGWVIRKISATTRADSISVDYPRDGLAALRALEESGGRAVEVTDAAILETQRLLARACGLFAEPSGAAGVAGLRALLRRGVVKPSEKAVCLVTGSGLKDVRSVLDAVGEPPLVAPRLEAVRKALGRAPAGRPGDRARIF